MKQDDYNEISNARSTEYLYYRGEITLEEYKKRVPASEQTAAFNRAVIAGPIFYRALVDLENAIRKNLAVDVEI